jgi:hypothetical protein
VTLSECHILDHITRLIERALCYFEVLGGLVVVMVVPSVPGVCQLVIHSLIKMAGPTDTEIN